MLQDGRRDQIVPRAALVALQKAAPPDRSCAGIRPATSSTRRPTSTSSRSSRRSCRSTARRCREPDRPVIDSPRARARRERKIVTVLFADLVGFTSRAEQTGPRGRRRRARPLPRARPRRARALRRHGREVHRRRGHGALRRADAHEDDPERAVRAALAIREWAEDGERRGADRSQQRRGARHASTPGPKPARRWSPATS